MAILNVFIRFEGSDAMVEDQLQQIKTQLGDVLLKGSTITATITKDVDIVELTKTVK
jgi:hypothetical protein